MTSAVETYLRALVARVDDPPLLRELTDADLGTPRGTASIARAALCWLRDGRDLEARVQQELAELDWTVRARWAEASHDVAAGFTAPPSNRVVCRSADEWLAFYERNAGVVA